MFAFRVIMFVFWFTLAVCTGFTALDIASGPLRGTDHPLRAKLRPFMAALFALYGAGFAAMVGCVVSEGLAAPLGAALIEVGVLAYFRRRRVPHHALQRAPQ